MLNILLISSFVCQVSVKPRSDYSVKLPQGTEVQVLAVENDGKFWAPDGSRLDEKTLAVVKAEAGYRDRIHKVFASPIEWAGKPIIHVVFLHDTPIENLGITGVAEITAYETLSNPKRFRAVGFLSAPSGRGPEKVDVDVRIAEKPFAAVARSVRINGAFKRVLGFDLKPAIPADSSHIQCKVPVIKDGANTEGKLAFFYSDGSLAPWTPGSFGPNSMNTGGYTDDVVGSDFPKITRVEYQTRHYVLILFKAIHLRPNGS